MATTPVPPSTAKALPEGVRLETLKTHARDLRNAARAGEPRALQRVAPYFDDASALKLQQAQLVVAREYGFASWRKLKSYVDARHELREAERELAAVAARMQPSEALLKEFEIAQTR